VALREWRWRIVEPVLFYALIRFYLRRPGNRQRILWAWLLTGVGVAAIGLLQLAGVNLVPAISRQTCFSADVVVTGGVQRATSVYCHPNNLGLALGRVWPVLAAMAVPAVFGSRILRYSAWWRAWRSPALVYMGLCAIVLAGIGASFSKGAVMGAGAALVTLGVVLRKRVLLALALAAVVLVVSVALLTRVERLNPLGGSSGARVELWQSAAAMLRDHPLLGVGLDQFYTLRNQEGSRYLAPEAALTSERYASHPHNFLLDIWLRMGLGGLLAFAALIVQFIRRVWTIRDEQRVLVAGLTAALVAALVHGLVDNFYFVEDLAFVFWLHLALVDDAWSAAQREHSNESPVPNRPRVK
jgi:O-antigen ligase